MTLGAVESCPDCRGAGWLVQRKDSVDSVVQCPRCRNATRVRRLLEKAEIPPRYFDRGFDVYRTHHPKQEAALKRCVDFVESFPAGCSGLLLVGPFGVGKTHLSVAVLKTIVEEKRVASRFVDETELLRRLHYSYDPSSSETERQVLRPLMDADLLVWDDLGTGRPTEWARETMRTVLNYRYTYKKHTIFTTNRALETTDAPRGPSGETVKGDRGLAETIGQHLFSRIMEMCEIVEVDGPDARTEIHKAGQDFRRRRETAAREGVALVIPTGMIRCPRCDAPRISRLDVSRPKRSASGAYVEVACLCEKCQNHFLARYYPRRGRIEYPSPHDT